MDPVVLTEEDAEMLDSCEAVLRYFDIRIKRGDHISSQDWLNAAARLNVLMRDEEVEWIRLEQEVAKEEEFYQTGEGGEMSATRAKNKVKTTQKWTDCAEAQSLQRRCEKFLSIAKEISNNQRYG